MKSIEAPAPAQRTERRVLALVLAAVLLPVAAVLATRLGGDHVPLQDLATLQVRLRDLLSADTSLAGPYSQYGWNHPGPFIYWALAPLVWLLGDGSGLIIASALFHGGVLTGIAVLAQRTGGTTRLLFWSLLALLAYPAAGATLILQAWNPYLTLIVFVAFLLLLSTTSQSGDHLAWLVAAATFLVQSHVGYTLLVLAGLGWLLVSLRRSATAVNRRSATLAAGVAAILWLPVLVDMLMHDGGNPRAVASWFLSGDRPDTTGPGDGLQLLAAAFRIVPSWLGGPADRVAPDPTAVGASISWLVIPLALVAIGVWLRPRVGPYWSRLLSLSWTMVAAALAALSLLRGNVFDYVFLWREVTAALLVLTTLTAGLSYLCTLNTDLRPHLLRVAAGTALVALSLLLSIGVARQPEELRPKEAAAKALLGSIDLDSAPGSVLIRWAGPSTGGVYEAVISHLDRAGAARVDEDRGFQWGHHLTASPSEVEQVWYVSDDEATSAALLEAAGATAVAVTSDETGECAVIAFPADRLPDARRLDVALGGS